jgi:hypothetical protein
MQVLGTTASHVSFPILTGGTLYTGANHYYRKFTTSGTLTTTAPIEIEYIAIAGGGASGFRENSSGAIFRGAGGGAGRYANQTLTIPAGSWDITVGAGGYWYSVSYFPYTMYRTAEPTDVSGTAGFDVYLPGGGRGGSSNGSGAGTSGLSGGSGGGGGVSWKTTGGAGGAATAGTPTGNGNAGGGGPNSSATFGVVNAGGGGGASGAGGSGSSGGSGGSGINLSGTEWNTVASVPVNLGQGGNGTGTSLIIANSGYGNGGDGSSGSSGIFTIRYLKSAVGG